MDRTVQATHAIVDGRPLAVQSFLDLCAEKLSAEFESVVHQSAQPPRRLFGQAAHFRTDGIGDFQLVADVVADDMQVLQRFR
ncbi:MAG: hypothetical protein N0A03_10360, partial [Anaerolineae bacterium]|nr:hypothetical protein [Anaerolineae bacterium]